eukprot:TRINITY_DN9963_c0_g1_i2.p1 TRINITY_DN9963_c0_g1~~TRINITY_DN9963_c0_g1_i2.p1  ORF type:complete len:294 (+),score=22.38 TRINITY_DN9963_c0_g1_i2:65-946(+)
MSIRNVPGYEVEGRIGEGSSGRIYKGRDLKSGEEVAIKVVDEMDKTLMAEASFYRKLGGIKGIPKMRWWGMPKRGVWALVVDKLSQSLTQINNSFDGHLPRHGIVLLGIQMLDRISDLHSRGILHRDIKPDNFMMGSGASKNDVFLIDFGLSRSYIDDYETHYPQQQGLMFSGTPDFASLNVHMGNTPSRRDDVESLCYVLIYFFKGALPWQGLGGSTNQQIVDRVTKKKLSTSISDLCEGVPTQMKTFLTYVRELKYTEAPDYKYLRGLLKSIVPGFNIDQPLSQVLSRSKL